MDKAKEATKTILVRYKTAKEHADANAASVRAVFDALRASAPNGINYATYRMEDGVTFVHLATMASATANRSLTSLPAFKAFQAKLQERCVEMPQVSELSSVDSYTSRPGETSVR